MWRRPIQQLFLNLSNVPAACDTIVGILGCRNLTTTNVEALPYLLVCCQRPTLKASQHRETTLHPKERGGPPSPGPPADTIESECNHLGSPLHCSSSQHSPASHPNTPDNFSTSCILILENFLQSRLVSQLKIANIAKQNCSDSWVWSHKIHMAIHNVQPQLPFYCPLHSQSGSWSKHLSTGGGRASGGQGRQCDVFTALSNCLKICKDSYPSGAARTGTHVIRPSSAPFHPHFS